MKRGCKVRCFTEVTTENISFCKKLTELVTEFRHLQGIEGGIAINKSEYIATSIIESGQPVGELYYSNLTPIVEQGQYIFNTFWKNSVPAIKKIREIEEGIVAEVIESINDPILLQSNAVELLRSACKEILIIFSSANAFERQKKVGAIKVLKQIAQIKPQVKIRILTPKTDHTEKTCRKLAHNSNLDYKFIDPIVMVTILVVDRKFSIVVELKDDTKKTIAEAIGLATYSNSLPTVSTYALLFDALWNQTNMYEQLQIHDKMQKQFINSVAHDLRTSLTSIIGLTQHVIDKFEDGEQRGLLDVVLYNGKRLQSLSENSLALTKIESNLLNLSEQTFDLGLLLHDVIKDFELSLERIQCVTNPHGKKICFRLKSFDGRYLIKGDQYRITQVVSNLIYNAINSILGKEGLIVVSIEKKVEDDTNFVITHIKDNGDGIHSEIISRLFTKFATKSFYGTGLGLYVCKEIIEMHRGMIWGKNNEHDKGATFSFKLPVIDQISY